MTLTTTAKLNLLAHKLLDRGWFRSANVIWKVTRWFRDRPARRHRRRQFPCEGCGRMRDERMHVCGP